MLTVISLPLLAGTQGFSSLKIMPGAREIGMGATGCASASGPQAMAWNPAATAGGSLFAVTATHTAWLQGCTQQSLFLTRRFGKTALGAGIRSFTPGVFEYREGTPTAEPLGTFQPVELSAYFNAGYELGDTSYRLRGVLGVNLRYFYSKVMSYEADGSGLDIGVRLYTRIVSIGASLTDFGQTLAYTRDRIWLPTRTRLGTALKTAIGQCNLTATVDFSYFIYGRQTRTNAGFELAPVRHLRLRAGYELGKQIGQLSCGLGLAHDYLALDYSWTMHRYDLGSAHRISLSLTL
ncbi:MAG: PorV/PorQ family protein [candidate division WOR-3 bacterium]